MQVHPSQISPGEPFDIFYFIRNHTDGTTYYVQAKVYDVRTGELLATENLTQSPTNSRLFVKTLQAPPDPVGIGRNIVAIATVYTDSGYTTKSQSYEEQEQYYLIKPLQTMFGGGGIDYRAIREMFEETIVRKTPKPAPPTDYGPAFNAIFGAIGTLQREINRIPKEAPDAQPLLSRLNEIKDTIADLPEPEKTDLTPILDKLDTVTDLLKALPTDIKLAGNAIAAQHETMMREVAAQILETVKQGMKDFMDGQQVAIPFAELFQPRNAPEEPSTADVRSLLS